MTTDQIVQLIVGLGLPISGIFVAWIANRRSRNETPAQTHTIANTKVTETDAHTRELTGIVDGFSLANRAAERMTERALRAASDCDEKYQRLEERFEASEQRYEKDERARRAERQEMIDHIRALEDLIPTPPGPPERPAWH